MKKIFFIFTGLIWAFALNSQNIISKTLLQVRQTYCFKNASIAMTVKDLQTGEIITDFNSNKILKPASTLKLFTTAAALEVLGKNYRYTTRLQYDGRIDTSTHTLKGNLYIKGGGDPTLGSKYFDPDHIFIKNMVEAVKKAGIDTIEGKIIGDAQIFGETMIPGKWAWEDIGNYYAAGACGLTIFDNLYTLHFRTSSYSGGKTKIFKIEPEIPGLRIKNYVRSANIRSDMAYIYGSPYTYERTVKGKLPRARTDFKVKGSIPDPAFFAAYTLFYELKKAGIVIKDTCTTIRLLQDSSFINNERKTFFTHYSPRLEEIINKTNTKSINLFAEHLARSVALKIKSSGEMDSVPSAITNFWQSKGINMSGAEIYDGCGLSAYNGLTTRQLTDLLVYMFKSENFKTFENSLAITGEKGTLKYYCKQSPAKGKIKAKTGTLRKVKAFAGFAQTQSGKKLAFAIIINGYSCSSRYAKKYFEKLLCSLVQYK